MGRAKKVKYSYYGYEYVIPALLSEWQAVWSDGSALLETNPTIIATYSPGVLVCEDNQTFTPININSTEIGFPGNGNIGTGDVIYEYTDSQGFRFYYISTGYPNWEFKVDTPDFSTLTAFGADCLSAPTGTLSLTWLSSGAPPVGGFGSQQMSSNTTYTIYSGSGNWSAGEATGTMDYTITDDITFCNFVDSFTINISLNKQYRFTQRIGDCYIDNVGVGSGLFGYVYDNPWNQPSNASISGDTYYTYNGKLYFTCLFNMSEKGDYFSQLDLDHYIVSGLGPYKTFSFRYPEP